MFAKLLLATIVGAHAGSDTTVPAAVVTKVRDAIAVQWKLPSERIQLEWSRVPAIAAQDSIDVSLLGQAGSGWFVVLLTRAGHRLVSLRVRAGLTDSVVVAARAVAPGARLVAADVRREERVQWGPPTIVPDVIGWEARRPIAAGELLSSTAVQSPRLIAAGDTVTLSWATGDVSVGISGVALGTGRLGETLFVRVDQRRLAAQVTGAGTARLKGQTP